MFVRAGAGTIRLIKFVKREKRLKGRFWGILGGGAGIGSRFRITFFYFIFSKTKVFHFYGSFEILVFFFVFYFFGNSLGQLASVSETD